MVKKRKKKEFTMSSSGSVVIDQFRTVSMDSGNLKDTALDIKKTIQTDKLGRNDRGKQEFSKKTLKSKKQDTKR